MTHSGVASYHHPVQPHFWICLRSNQTKKQKKRNHHAPLYKNKYHSTTGRANKLLRHDVTSTLYKRTVRAMLFCHT